MIWQNYYCARESFSWLRKDGILALIGGVQKHLPTPHSPCSVSAAARTSADNMLLPNAVVVANIPVAWMTSIRLANVNVNPCGCRHNYVLAELLLCWAFVVRLKSPTFSFCVTPVIYKWGTGTAKVTHGWHVLTASFHILGTLKFGQSEISGTRKHVLLTRYFMSCLLHF